MQPYVVSIGDLTSCALNPSLLVLTIHDQLEFLYSYGQLLCDLLRDGDTGRAGQYGRARQLKLVAIAKTKMSAK